MARLPHGASITLEALRKAQEKLVNRSADIPLAFVAAVPGDTHDFDFLFPELQNDPTNLLPEAGETIDNLIRLGRTMRDASGGAAAGDSDIPAAYT
jgi:hypothetical protein